MHRFSVLELVVQLWYQMANGVLYQLAEGLHRGVGTREQEAIRLLTKIIARFVTFDKALGLTRLRVFSLAEVNILFLWPINIGEELPRLVWVWGRNSDFGLFFLPFTAE